MTGIEPTTSGLLDQRRSHSDNQAPLKGGLNVPFHWYELFTESDSGKG